jgi:transcriptional regulator with XRE-family HTH domain
MGYRGKVELQEKARLMRAEGRTLQDIATTLGVSKSSVSLWVRDIPFVPGPRQPSINRRPHPQQLAKVAEIAECNRAGVERIGMLSTNAFLAAGVALYAGEGSKTEGKVLFANTDSQMVGFFCAWLREFFVIDEARMRVRVYLHEGLDLEAAESFWSGIAEVPRAQFREPYRAKPDPSIRLTKHEYGCVYVYYCCSRTHREIMGLVRALLSSDAIPG